MNHEWWAKQKQPASSTTTFHVVRRLLVAEKLVQNVATSTHSRTRSRRVEWIKRQAKAYFVKAYAVFLGYIPIPIHLFYPHCLIFLLPNLASLAPPMDKLMLIHASICPLFI